MSINRVNISGNLTRDGELRTTQGGTSILSFGVAVNDRRQNPQTQEWEDCPNFVDCTIFGRRAEALADILKKGLKVAIEGKLRYSSWEKDGQRRSKLEVVVDEVELMTSRADRPQARQGAGQPYYPQQAASPAQVPRPVAQMPPQPAYGAPQPQQANYPNMAPSAPNKAAAAPQTGLYGAYRPQVGYRPPAPQLYDEEIPF